MTAPSQNTFLAARPKIICGWHVFGGARRAPELPACTVLTIIPPPHACTRTDSASDVYRVGGRYRAPTLFRAAALSVAIITQQDAQSQWVCLCVCWCSCMFVQRCDSALTSSISASDSPFSRRNRRLFGSNPSKSVCGSCARNIESEQTNKQKCNALACIAHGVVRGLDAGSRLDMHSHAYRTNVGMNEWICEECLALGWSLYVLKLCSTISIHPPTTYIANFKDLTCTITLKYRLELNYSRLWNWNTDIYTFIHKCINPKPP